VGIACGAALVAGAVVGAGVDEDAGDQPTALPPQQSHADAASGSAEAAPAGARVDELSLREQVGQLVILRFDGTEVPSYVADALRAGEASGAILFSDNVVSEPGLSALTRGLQRSARGSALIATDQEGGEVRNVPFAPPETAPSLLTSPAEAERLARATGRELRALGVNVNLAPVADVASVPGSVVAGRAYPGGASRVAAFVERAVRGYMHGGVAATAKHFPGLGAAERNTDDAAVTIGRGPAELDRTDLQPFRRALSADVPLVMASHALYPGLDRSRIASQSRRILTGLLRRELGFGGAIVTDSLEAEAVLSRTDTPTAAVRSAAAGADLLLTTSSGSYPPVVERLRAEAHRSDAFRARVEDAAARVLALKQRIGLEPPPALRDGGG
jgi:beta-N-acetylhexosaminidase